MATQHTPGGGQHDRLRERYADALVGRRIGELPTPILLLRPDAAQRNIDRMAAWIADRPVALRPHVKVHKSPELALRQRRAGAIGVTTATASEAVVMAAAGAGPVLIANQVLGHDPLAQLAQAAGEGAELIVAVDSTEGVERLSAASRRAGASLQAVVEVDVGMGRSGARTVADALRLGAALDRAPGVELRGVIGYEGHCADDPDPVRRAQRAGEATTKLVEAADTFARESLPAEIVSAGGTGTYASTGDFAGITELQAGSYVLMDGFHAPLVSGFEHALTVLASVISAHGALAVCDAGRKAVGAELLCPTLRRALPETTAATDTLAFIHEEHSGWLLGGGAAAVGDQLELIPGYAPTAVNLYPFYAVVEDEVVSDLWPICGRHWDGSSNPVPM